jgi:hypothetical protein
MVYDNLDDLLPPGISPEMTLIEGDSIYMYEMRPTWPLAFNDGDRISWCIQATDIYGAIEYYPGPTEDEKEETRVYDYETINGSLRIVDAGAGLAGIETRSLGGTDPDTVVLRNNKSIAYKIAVTPPAHINSDYDAWIPESQQFGILPRKSFPFGFISPPKMMIDNVLLSDSDSLLITIDRNDPWAAYFTLSEFIFQLLGTAGDVNNSQTLKDLSSFMSSLELLRSVANDPEFISWSRADQLTRLLMALKPYIDPTNPQNKITEISQIIGGVWAGKLIQIVTPLNQIQMALLVSNLLITAYDVLTSPAQDTIVIDNKNWIRVDISADLPGQDNPFYAGSSQILRVAVTNTSQQKLYNIWVGMDILRPDSNAKIENTQTPIPDTGPFGTGVIGNLVFPMQGIDLDINDSFEFVSQPYEFSSSVTGFDYYACELPYYFSYSIWTSGYPGAHEPLPAIRLTNRESVPFRIKDNVAPFAPTMDDPILNADSTAVLIWRRHPQDRDLQWYIVYYSTAEYGTYFPTDTVSVVPGDSGSVLPVDRNSAGYYKVSCVDIGNNEGPMSSAVSIGAAPAIYITPAVMNFDSVTVSDCSTDVFVISNTGLNPVSGVASVLAPFFIESGAEYHNLMSGSTHNVTVRFCPDNIQTYEEFVTFTGGGGAVRLVTGTGVLPTGIDDRDDDHPLPTEYSLHQNYPNPFNPITEISFALPNAANVKLEIFNIMGQRVATLVDQHLEAGNHSVTWDGSRVASGIYFYRFDAGDFVESKKMVLLK